MIGSYSKIYNVGHRETNALLDTLVWVQEKIDGSQISFGVIDGELQIRSKNATVDLDNPGMFAAAVKEIVGKKSTLVPGWVYRGEYLRKPKHNTLAYDRVPASHIVLFDVEGGNGSYDYLLPHEVYLEAERIGFEPVRNFGSPKLYQDVLANDSWFHSSSQLGGCTVEGIVLKQYELYDQQGKILMAKYVSPQFREKHVKDWKDRNPGHGDIIEKIAASLATEARYLKAVQHLRDKGELTNSPKDIGPLLKELHQDIKDEEYYYILEELFKWAWKRIAKRACAGFPLWYKDHIVKEQLNDEPEVDSVDDGTGPQTD